MVSSEKTNLSAKDIAVIAILAVVLFIQEEVLTFLPNVQLTVFLIVLYTKKLGFKKTTIIILIYVILDNLVMGSLSFFYTPFMFIGWELISVLLSTIFKRLNASLSLGLAGILFSFLYCWIYIIPNILLTKINVVAYLASDFLFEIILACSSFVSILWLYEPCSKVFDKLLK